MMRCGDTRCTVSCIASQALLCSVLGSGKKMGLVVALLAERWSLPEVQGGARGPHVSFVVLPGE